MAEERSSWRVTHIGWNALAVIVAALIPTVSFLLHQGAQESSLDQLKKDSARHERIITELRTIDIIQLRTIDARALERIAALEARVDDLRKVSCGKNDH